MTVKKISFIGAGNMTKAIVEGLVNKAYPSHAIMATNPSQGKLDDLHGRLDIGVSNKNEDAIEFADIIVLAVKPQLMQQVCSDFLAEADISGKLFISIAAGVSVGRLSEILQGHQNIIRVMANTPSAIGLGMSGIYASPAVAQPDIEFASFLMTHVGETLLVAQESDIDTVIAAASSSPAYFFYIAEAMQETAMEMGLSAEDARKLIQQTMLGSAALMIDRPEVSLQELRNNVTSKGGTTAEAISSLQNHKLDHILHAAMHAAVKRAKQMAKDF